MSSTAMLTTALFFTARPFPGKAEGTKAEANPRDAAKKAKVLDMMEMMRCSWEEDATRIEKFVKAKIGLKDEQFLSLSSLIDLFPENEKGAIA
mmetsp:Transcript_20452/g.25832  ORF Transcript_20452/g.25832 Transcript_20452/m.25832 type:complete len:93 (-) Transcript_20452:7-285(-)